MTKCTMVKVTRTLIAGRNESEQTRAKSLSAVLTLRLYEFEQVGIDLVCIRGWHAVRETFVGFQ
ncbi:MAG: hypothetical protein JWM21_3167 [Acidobacteria bacterium]|nr:hypothetical protein [Acidobacteriota bacterium]